MASDKLLCAKGISCILKKLAQTSVVMATDVHNITPLLIKITTRPGTESYISYTEVLALLAFKIVICCNPNLK